MFLTDIVAAVAKIEPVSVDELAIHNWPPTALTDSFSNVVVLIVPLILTFSNSAVPFPSDDIFHPFNPLAKSLVCKIPSGLIKRFPPSIDAVVISQPPIDADLNDANPSDVIDELAFVISAGEPAIVAGVNIWSTDKSPLTTKLPSSNWTYWDVPLLPKRNPSDAVIWPFDLRIRLSFIELIWVLATSNPAIVPPLNNTFEPVIWPLSFNIRLSFAELIWDVLISNPPIDADTNLANPSDVIDADAFSIVDCEPPIVAGVNIWFADKSAFITVPAPITNELFFGSKWNKDELISMFESEPLINWVLFVPIKNLSVLTSNNPPSSVVNIKCLSSLSPIICIPTPCSTSSPISILPEPL